MLGDDIAGDKQQCAGQRCCGNGHYPVANHQSAAFRDDFAGQSFPVTEEICATCLSLPIGPHLSDDQVSKVIEAVRTLA